MARVMLCTAAESYGRDSESNMSPQTYVMPMFVRLTVADVDATRDWYHRVLGFDVVSDIPHTMAHLRGRRYQDLLIVKGEAASTPGQGVILSFDWKQDVDDLVTKVEASGGKVVDGPSDRPWGARELVVEDPNGYRLCFSQQRADKPLAEALSGETAGKQ
jgi:catechol 2,3-dioxygenase-like lactoylglutathione lyase family enzyme